MMIAYFIFITLIVVDLSRFIRGKFGIWVTQIHESILSTVGNPSDTAIPKNTTTIIH